MVNKQYAQGRRIEYKIVDHFKKEGFYAWRTAGSHGHFDVIATSHDELILAQVKSYRDKMNSTEKKKALELLRTLPCPEYVTRMLIIYKIGTGIEEMITI